MTRDDATQCSSGTTFIGVIDALDSTRQRAAVVKKSIVKSARNINIRPTLKKGKSERVTGSPRMEDDFDISNTVPAGLGARPLGGSQHSRPSWYDPFSADNSPCYESDEEKRIPPTPATKGTPLTSSTIVHAGDAGSRSSKASSKTDSKSSKKDKKRLSVTIQKHAAVIETEEKQRADAIEREARKERVREKLEKYKEDRRTLKSNCTALEAQLIETAEKLREVDSKAAYKIDSLEVELAKTREGMENLVNLSTKEVTDQSQCIKTLGKKLIRQAHVIKQQKKAVEAYQIQLEALREEMAMQDERDSSRDEEYNDLKEDFERTLQQKVAMQNSLQESIEEMMDLKLERERASARIRELELTLQEKEIDLERAKRENVELSERISTLETDLQDKSDECDVVASKLKANEQSVEVFKAELERANAELEELRGKMDDALSASHHTAPPQSTTSRETSFRGWRRGVGAPATSFNEDESTMIEKLQAKELQVQALGQAAKENEETIKTLRSDMVKMSSTFKQDDYLKRKQIAKLKQDNAEYALKLRALEKAFKGVHSDPGLTMTLGGSRHAQSMHASSSLSANKEDRAEAVKARLGGSLARTSLAPYEFPSEQTSETWSDEGRKGEWPEEC